MELHDVVWRNDLHRLEHLLQHVHDCNVPDQESHWTPLHFALHYGLIRAALKLLQTGARFDVVDRRDRTPLDLISKDCPHGTNTKTDVFSWGNGMNYQLGTGNTGCSSTPHRLERLRGKDIHKVAVSKFHGLAVGVSGEVYSWGWGMGGRLGHPEARLYSQGQAQLFPKKIDGLKDTCVVAIAAAKHHSLAVTSTGDVYSWGCNPDGRLGYPTGGNKRVSPKRLTGLKGIKVIQVAAANAHCAVVSESGTVYTWGSNVQGQLGYGTSDSCYNVSPRPVDGLKHRRVTQISLAKHHTMALTEEGEVYTWGHKCVAPRRIGLTGSREKESMNVNGMPLQFHRGATKVKRPLAVMIAAGVDQSCCLTASGVVLCWTSDTPSTIKEVAGALIGKIIISIAAGKHKTAAVASNGCVYVWDRHHSPSVVSGMQNVIHVSVGEQHFLALQKWNADVAENTDDTASESHSVATTSEKMPSIAPELEIETSGFAPLVENAPPPIATTKVTSVISVTGPPSLQWICEKAVVYHVLEPRTVVDLLRYADISGSRHLRRCCLHFIIQNTALVLHESHKQLMTLTDELLLEIEQEYQKQILGLDVMESEGSCSRRPTYRLQSGSVPASPSVMSVKTTVTSADNRFLPQQGSVQKLKKHVETKLKQIKALEKKSINGYRLDAAQLAKMARRDSYQRALDGIHAGTSYADIQSMLSDPPSVSSIKQESLPVCPLEAAKKLPTEPAVISVVPRRSRDIGHLPRFLEPSRQKRTLKGQPLTLQHNPRPQESFKSLTSDPVHHKAWTTLELESSSKSHRSFGFKAVPSKECKRMSLSDFMVTPEEPPMSPKECGPAWGGIHFSDVSSFASIQEEQRNHRPGMRSNGTEVAVMQRRTVGRWQMHSDVQVQSIKCIQIEEKAVQELSAMYGGASVKIRPGTARECTKPMQP